MNEDACFYCEKCGEPLSEYDDKCSKCGSIVPWMIGIENIDQETPKTDRYNGTNSVTDEPDVDAYMIEIPADYQISLKGALPYDRIGVFENRTIGYIDDEEENVWFYDDYYGVKTVESSAAYEFSQVVFMNGTEKTAGVRTALWTPSWIYMRERDQIILDRRRILIKAGLLGSSEADELAEMIAQKIRKAMFGHKNKYSRRSGSEQKVLSAADEIMKLKNLFDCGAITQEEYDAKKKQLLGL